MSPFSKGGLRGILLFLFFYSSIVLLTSCATYEKYPGSGYGVASWYGSEFHGRPTSSGEVFNMYALTCAHREYPFGTRLKVTNVSNNKSIDCLVNDRGPFVSGRDLDLSYAAAREIGLIGTGICRVRIEYMGRDGSYAKEVKYLVKVGPFTIQVGSFGEFSNALRLKTALELKYGGVYVTEVEINGNRFYRVRIGKFRVNEEMLLLAQTLAQEGYTVFITRYEEKM